MMVDIRLSKLKGKALRKFYFQLGLASDIQFSAHVSNCFFGFGHVVVLLSLTLNRVELLSISLGRMSG